MLDQKSIEFNFRYELSSDERSMDAKIFNKSQACLINALEALNKYFSSSAEVKISSRKSGSIIDNILLYFREPAVLAIVGAFVIFYFDKLLYKRFNKIEDDAKRISAFKEIVELSNGKVNSDILVSLVSDKALSKAVSTYFNSIENDKVVHALEISAYDHFSKSIMFDTIKINRNKFHNYIIHDVGHKTIEQVYALIYIVSPILVKGSKAKWRGIYEKDMIEFKMSDYSFLAQVYNHKVKFSNGTYIVCLLNITKNINILNEKETMHYDVASVEACSDEPSLISYFNRNKLKIHSPKQGYLFNYEE
jgi:hypothetical protein